MLKETISELDTRLANIKLIQRHAGVVPGEYGNVLQGRGWDVVVFCKISESTNIRGFRIEEKAAAFGLFEDYAQILKDASQ
jgi:hypothetical protein